MSWARKTFAHDVLIVAGQELGESLRTKRALLMLVLFSGMTVFFTFLVTKLVITIEEGMLDTLHLSPGASGTTTSVLWNHEFFRHIVRRLADGDSEVAQMLLSYTPFGIFYGFLMIHMAPWLVALTSSARITEEIWGGGARFVLCRTTRFAWTVGKFIGQALQLLLALVLTAAAAWLTCWFRLDSFEGALTLRDMVIFAPKAWLYGLAFLGLVSGISMYCKTPGIANVLGIVGFLAATALYYISKHNAGDGWRQIFDAIQIVLPHHHYFNLMYPDWEHTLPSALFLFALGLGYLLIGYARLARKDL